MSPSTSHNPRHWIATFVTTLAVLALIVSPAFAQQASLAGTVSDTSKAVLPGATVTVTSSETGAQLVTVTDERGEYRWPRVAPGRYNVKAELQGFSSVVVEGIDLLVGQNANLPITLSVANVSETITVSGESPLVDTTSSQVAGNVDRRQMESVPLQGRNWLELSKLVKGITANEITNTRSGR